MAAILYVQILVVLATSSGALAEYWNGIKSRSPPFNYTCYPNDTMVVDNTNVLGFRSSFANDSTSVCTTTYNEQNTKLYITGCNMDDDILLVFTNRTEDLDSIIGGYGVDAYIIRCNDIPDTGVSRAVIQGFTPILRASTIAAVTPNVHIHSAIRESYEFGSPEVLSSVLTTRLAWTIDIPEQYYGLPLICVVVSGTDPFSTTARSKTIIERGCTTDEHLVGSFLDHITQSPIRRYYTDFYAFKFYDSDFISIRCSVEFCKNEEDCLPSCPFNLGRRRRDTANDLETFSTGVTLKVVDPLSFTLSAAQRTKSALLGVLVSLILGLLVECL